MLNWLGKKTGTAAVSSDMISKQRRYETLVRALHGDLYRYAYWLCHDASVAEDLVQETFLRAWKALDSLKDDKAAKSWLITILRRENARRFERKQLDLTDIDQCQVADQDSLSNEQVADHQVLHRQMRMLSPEYREPLILQVMYGFSGEEIAEILELNRNTVMTRLFRARNQLREALNPTQASRGHSNG
ncbi:sigma-70 family RNA polymerase sigma factor [Ferrimonas balearica]|uniref:sigma-70 family RNA polymerase sigma factor n=1 Tax=Ferrimonas balearica TaxID=44012 RepID=UPI001C9942E4|nr:sigma-70 family RNA polymerase sigma factor [Ferrimonas balearica]MBY5992957.1 sigma-70 family RNA polymerase sigma factor [Ferrimonas balearica]